MYATIINSIPSTPHTTSAIHASILARDALEREANIEVYAHVIESQDAGTGHGIHHAKFMYTDGTVKTFDGEHWS